MGIVEEVSSELKAAMKSGDAIRRQALRNIRTALLNEMKRDGSESLSDEACIEQLRRLAKQRKESIEAFEAAGRAEQAQDERGELAVIEEWLPSMADDDTVRSWAKQAIEETGAESPSDVGRVMGALMRSHKGEMDGAAAKRIVAELLGG